MGESFDLILFDTLSGGEKKTGTLSRPLERSWRSVGPDRLFRLEYYRQYRQTRREGINADRLFIFLSCVIFVSVFADLSLLSGPTAQSKQL